MDDIRRHNHTVTQTVTRPADTTAYAAGDAVGGVIAFAGAAKSNEGGVINQLLVIDSANVATKPDLELWLFDTTIAAAGDNAAFAPSDAEIATLIGVILIPTASFKIGNAVASTGNSMCDLQNLGLPFNCKPGVNAIFGQLVARNAYVPLSGEVFTLRLKVLD